MKSKFLNISYPNYYFLKYKFDQTISRYMVVTVPKKLVNMFMETRAPKARFGGNTEANSTRNPAMTTMALKTMARPECCMVFRPVCV